ncbi:FecCD family ABC transporter permease [Saccharopolyspora sp. NPDC000995]
MLFWITGGLGAARWESLPVTALVLAIGLVVAVAAGRWMNVLHGGDDAAAAFGLKTPGRCGWCACSGSLLAGTAVAVVGGIVFAGLLVPHAATFLVGAEARRMLSVSALLGAVFVVLADLAARLVIAPSELPVGGAHGTGGRAGVRGHVAAAAERRRRCGCAGRAWSWAAGRSCPMWT